MWLPELMKPTPDWDVLEDRLGPMAWDMKGCIQDPVHHAEGDVWTHTRMVFEALAQFGIGDDPACRLTALFHDVHKPITRTVEFDPEQGREVVRHPRHARLGAKQAWRDMWLAGVDLKTRLEVYWLCMWHQKVFHMWSYEDMQRLAYQFATVGRWSSLVNFARADNAGRICANPEVAVTNLALLEEYLREANLWDAAPSWGDHARTFYFEKDGRSPFFEPPAPTGSRVIVMSGLPGAGKDTYIRKHHPDMQVVSLDAIREDMDVEPTDNQGRVIQAAYERARELLRVKEPFVWNATGLTRQQRSLIIGVCRAYDAHVTIVAIDRPPDVVLRQNSDRIRSVPHDVIRRLVDKWEPPSALEAHQVLWV